MSKKTNIKFYKDHEGFDIPAHAIPELEKRKDKLSRKLLKKALDIEERLHDLKNEMVENCDGMFNEMLLKHDVKQDTKGSYTIFSYDKSIKIEVNVSNRIEFNDHINIAQAKINEYIREKTEGVDDGICKLINSAFTKSKGTLDAKRIIGLKKIQINHKLWKQAMELIDKSISTNSSKRYFSISQKDEEGNYTAVSLNFSNM